MRLIVVEKGKKSNSFIFDFECHGDSAIIISLVLFFFPSIRMRQFWFFSNPQKAETDSHALCSGKLNRMPSID